MCARAFPAGSGRLWQGGDVSVPSATPVVTAALHRAAQVEDAVRDRIERRMRRRGWRATVIPYAGYGAPGWVRVMGRVLLNPAPRHPSGPAEEKKPKKIRGWRSFTTVAVNDAPVVIEAGGLRREVTADRGGFVDAVVETDLEPGWRTVTMTTDGSDPVDTPVRIVDPGATFGIVSDIDDTVMVTALPRPLLAAWNTFVLDEHARAAVPGMAVLYERIVNAHPGAPVFYLSTGAWNVAPALTRFLSRHLYPVGPLLLTDWGPQKDRWFRNGQEHKRATLRRLASEFPAVKWLLIGDDGQHDPEIYADFARTRPDNVAAVAIRRLSPTQAVLAGALPAHDAGPTTSGTVDQRWLWAPDGAGLSALLTKAGLL
jgi:phosphatidate phosphatase APP1